MKILLLIVLSAGLAFSARGQMPFNDAGLYEQVGELHNEIFNFVKDNPPGPATEKDIVQAMDEYLGMMNSNITASEILNAEYREAAQQFRAASDKAQFLMDDAGFSTQGAGYYTQMIKGLSTNDYEKLYNTLVSLEEKISRDKSLNTHEKRLLLIASAIGRFSAFNWITNTSGSSSDQKVWVADALGAIEGGACGAATFGVITIGTAVIPGWVSGALFGAARGSIMAWLSNLE